MNIVNRVLAGLLLLALVVASIVVVLLISAFVDVAQIRHLWPYGPVETIGRDITRLGPARRAPVAIGTAAAGLLALLLFVLEFRRTPRRARLMTIHAEGPGYTEIAFGTLEDVVRHVGTEISGVEEITRARIDPGREGLRVACRARISPAAEMATAGSELEQTIARRVREATGVPVSSVRVRTEAGAAGSRAGSRAGSGTRARRRVR